MNLFRKLPGIERTPPGIEWRIWRRLPAIALWGTLLPALLALGLHLLAPADASAGAQRATRLLDYMLIGCIGLHWTLTATLAMGCIIVIVMKGPGYVADAYPLDREGGRR